MTTDAAAARTVIIHYHLFKNAGTSVDKALQGAFVGGWASFEGDGRGMHPEELADYLMANDSVQVVSSHVANFPVPEIAGVRVIPVVFVRNPIDRIRSGYDFERIQEADTPGANIAKENDFVGYFEKRLAVGDRSVRSFQTWRLAMGGTGPTELDRALDTIRQLPFVGLVEQYDASLARLTTILDESFPGLTLGVVHANRTTNSEGDLDDRLTRLRDDIGDVAYTALLQANGDDLTLWQTVRSSYQA